MREQHSIYENTYIKVRKKIRDVKGIKDKQIIGEEVDAERDRR